MIQISGYSSISSRRSRKERGVYCPRMGSETNLSRVGILAQLIPLCQSACHQSWRSTTSPSRVKRRSTSKTRVPAAYCASNASRQLGVVSSPMAPIPWAIICVLSKMSTADSAPSGGSFSWISPASSKGDSSVSGSSSETSCTAAMRIGAALPWRAGGAGISRGTRAPASKGSRASAQPAAANACLFAFVIKTSSRNLFVAPYCNTPSGGKSSIFSIGPF